MSCPDCGGLGYTVEEWSTENEHGQDTRRCDACGGSGEPTDVAVRALRQAAAEAALYLLDQERVAAQVHGKRLHEALVALSVACGEPQP